MERVIAFVLLVSTALLASAGAFKFREAHTPWQFNALVILSCVPIALALIEASRGRQRLIEGVQKIAVGAVTVLAITWLHFELKQSWPLAAAAALALFLILTGLVSRRSTSLAMALARANAALGSNPPKVREALVTLGQAEEQMGDDASMSQRALFAFLSASAQARTGNTRRASADASEAQALYEALAQPASVNSIRTLAREANLTITPLPPGGSYATQKREYSYRIALSGMVAVAAVFLLLRLWVPPGQLPTIPVLIVLGTAFGVWFLGLPWFVSRPRSAGVGLTVFSFAITASAVTAAVAAIGNGMVRAADFGPTLQRPIDAIRQWSAGLPPWASIAALGLFVCVALASLAAGKEATAKTLARVEAEMGRERWNRAVAGLVQLDAARERDSAVRDKILFWLAIAYRMSGEQTRAMEQLNRLLEASPKHREALYLAGHISLEMGDLDRAESFWRVSATSIRATPPFSAMVATQLHITSLPPFTARLPGSKTIPPPRRKCSRG